MFTVTQLDTAETWTRYTRNGAIGLADSIAKTRKARAEVKITATGAIEYQSHPSVFDTLEEFEIIELANLAKQKFIQKGTA